MFSIFNKKSTIHLDVFTFHPDLVKLFPVKLSAEFFPEWWKKLETKKEHFGNDRPTMRTCPGVVDYFKAGFILPLWKDFTLEMNSGVIRVDPQEEAIPHHPGQWGNGFPDYSHVKLVSPWRIQEKTGVNFLWTNTFWHKHFHNPFVPNGIVNYKYQTTTNVNLLMAKKSFPNKLLLEAGDPIAQIIPISDQKVKLHIQCLQKEEWMKLDIWQFSNQGNYYKRKKILQGKD